MPGSPLLSLRPVTGASSGTDGEVGKVPGIVVPSSRLSISISNVEMGPRSMIVGLGSTQEVITVVSVDTRRLFVLEGKRRRSMTCLQMSLGGVLKWCSKSSCSIQVER